MAESDDIVRRELGMTRREMLRRGAIVGGTLIWVAPVIQSLTTPASAHEAGSPRFFCCYCIKKNPGQNKPKGTCISGPTTKSACQSACVAAGSGKSKAHFHSSPDPISCDPERGCGNHRIK